MRLKIKDRRFDFCAQAPDSKSVYHRELIVRFLHGIKDDLSFRDSDSKDITATKECLKALSSDQNVLDCNESGSTLRFMIPVACAFLKSQNKKIRLVFKTAGRLFDRPLDDLEICLGEHGIVISKDAQTRSFIVEGDLTEGRFVIDGSVSSQYVSGLLMAMIVLPHSNVEVKGEASSIHYIELTKAVIGKYAGGVLNPELDVEGDWSAGAFLLCLDKLIDGHVSVGNLNADSVQGDKEILKFLSSCGADELTWDCRDIPDIVPYMAVTAAFTNKKTVFKNISRLRVKESDRVAAIREQLSEAGIKTEETQDDLTVLAYEENHPSDTVSLKSYNDHRMVMSALLLACALRCDLDIDTIDPVDKSFPGLKSIIREEFS
ncbi:MAG: hypothetical protein K6F79_05105 [Saccharofermentans sp.]|nr:hypothetical protein [Saccharofermentans sp.]